MPASEPEPRAAVVPGPAPPTSAAWWAGAAGGGVVVLAAVASYLTAFGNAFVRDDLPLIRDDPRLSSWSGVLGLFTDDYWGDLDDGGLYRPLTQVTYALNRSLAATGPDGPATFGFTVGNVALHAAAAWLVWRLARSLGSAAAGALAAGLVVAVHPAASEAVTGFVGRADVLAAAFVVAALLAWRRIPRDGGRARLTALAALAAGLLCKESAAAGFLLLPLSDLLLPADAPGPTSPGARGRRRLAGLPWLLALGLAWLALRWAVLGRLGPDPATISFGANPLARVPPAPSPLGNLYGFTPAEARLTALALVGRAARLLLWPAALSADASYDQIPKVASLADARALVGAAWALLVLGGALALRRRAPLAAFGLAWIAAAWLPVSNLVVPIGTVFAERTLYLPLLGFALVVGAGVTALVPRVGPRPVGVVLGVLLLAGAARTAARNLDWRDELTLWRATVAASPASHEAHATLGLVLGRRSTRAADPATATALAEEALASLRRGLAILPEHLDANRAAADLAWRLGRGAEARVHYENLMALEPQDPVHPAAAAAALMAAAREGGDWDADAARTDRAQRLLDRALALDPDRPESCFYQGVLLREHRGDPAAAAPWFARVLALRPQHPQRAALEAWIAEGGG